MGTRCPGRRLALAALLLAAAAAAAAGDPRPTVLVLGDGSSLPAGNGPSWAQVVQKARPDWRIAVRADGKRRLMDFAEPGAAAAALRDVPPADVVVVLLGTLDAAGNAIPAGGASEVGRAAARLLDALKAAPPTAKARLALCTPLPVIEARLDAWSAARFTNGERNCDAIAEALRGVAKDAGAALIDVHAWAKADVDEKGAPGRLLGSIGWALRDWGHPVLARYLHDEIARLDPQPADPAAFAAWKAETAASDALQQLLAQTSEGIVSHGAVHAAQPDKVGDKFKTWVIDLPPGEIAGPWLDVVFTSGGSPHAAIGNAANRPMLSTVLELNAEGVPVSIPLCGPDWQLIDESRPDAVLPGTLFRFNMQKMNYFAVTSGEPGARRWCLARFDLSPVAGKRIDAARIAIGIPASVERMVGPEQSAAMDHSTFGPPSVAAIAGQDAAWDNALATWRTRDGRIGWSGGKVDAARRRAALRSFLAANPPPGAAAAARAELAKLE